MHICPAAFLKTLSTNGPFAFNSFFPAKTKSAIIDFFFPLLFIVTMILKLLWLKKPAF